jgi:type I restriction enzyme S subunit
MSYLESFFQSSAGQLIMDVNSRGAAGRNRPLNTRSFLLEMIPVPSIDEQLEIEQFSNSLRRISDVFGRQIALIREYRTRLISDVVTGKIDVRHVAPSPDSEDLEEMAETLEPLEDAMADVEMDDDEDVHESA